MMPGAPRRATRYAKQTDMPTQGDLYVSLVSPDQRVQRDRIQRGYQPPVNNQPHITSVIPGLFGASQPMRSLALEIKRSAASDFSVLVCGESGTGKELVARSLHEH